MNNTQPFSFKIKTGLNDSKCMASDHDMLNESQEEMKVILRNMEKDGDKFISKIDRLEKGGDNSKMAQILMSSPQHSK